MRRIVTMFLIVLTLVAVLPLPASAITLVPCGRTDQTGTDKQCTFRHLIILISRVINYLMSAAAIVAMYFILLSGFDLITSLGNPEKIKKAQAGIGNAIVGFAIVVLGFVFVNLLVNGVFGKPGAERRWWDPKCIFNITDTRGCSVDTSSSSSS